MTVSRAIPAAARSWLYPFALLMACLAILSLVYGSTLLTQVSGGRDGTGSISPYMDDVGEIQVSLNVWGTIHFTGYPLFTILGNGCVALLRGLGVDAATAPSLYVMLWGLLGLSIFYLLLYNLTAKPIIAAACTLLLGLTRTIWIHNVVPEVYSMSFALSILLLAIALWRGEMSLRRVWLLALVGGIGVAHHRLIVLLAPGLLFAVLPVLRAQGRRTVFVVITAVLVGILGFLPYIYLPLRALAGADWVYGDPSTLAGFWQEFTGTEAAYLMERPPMLAEDLTSSVNIVLTELTPILAAGCALACVYSLLFRRHRRQMLIALLSITVTALYLIVQHRVVMPQAVAMPIVMVLVLGLGLALDTPPLFPLTPRRELGIIAASTIGLGIVLVGTHRPFIVGLTHDATGLRMIETAQRVPRDGGHAVLMLPWGPNHTAVAFSKYVTSENADLGLVEHTADFPALAQQGAEFYTFKDVFYRFGIDFWEAQLGRVYLSAAAEDVVAIKRQPLTAAATMEEIPITNGIVLRSVSVCSSAEAIHLTLVWRAAETPTRDFSVFVHLLNADSDVPLAQADSAAPVYGWYPTSRWSTGEVIYDYYVLPRLPEGERAAVGMYEQINGAFQNYGRTILPLDFALACDAVR